MSAARRKPVTAVDVVSAFRVHDITIEYRHRQLRGTREPVVIIKEFRAVCACGVVTGWDRRRHIAKIRIDRHTLSGQLSIDVD